MQTKLSDILIAITVALFVGLVLATIIETIAFGDVHIDRFIASYE